MPLERLSLGDLRIFSVTAQAGSISSASAMLGYSQSAISRRIAAIEQAMGFPLFLRMPRGVALTTDGVRMAEHATRILDVVQAAERDLVHAREPTRQLRVGVFASANAWLVPQAVRRLHLLAPDIRVTVREGLTPSLLRRLGEGDSDLAVVSEYQGSLDPPKNVRLRHLLDDAIAVVLPSGHPLAVDPNLRLADLAEEAWILGTHGTSPLIDAARRAGFTPRVAHRVGDWTAKTGFVAAGLGVTVIPTLGVAAVRPDVVVRPLPADFPSRAVYLATSRSSAARTEVVAWVDVIVALARDRAARADAAG
jgi:DNA-binding transcriptional LysR family regulator